jgi:hypothetical protein
MKLLKELGLIALVLTLSGCTVLGFATDLALASALDGNSKPGDPNYVDNTELFFTQKGLKHDVKVVKNLMDELSDSSNNFTSVSQENKQTQPRACKSVEDGKQQCYAPEYYQDMYIKDGDNQQVETSSSQD